MNATALLDLVRRAAGSLPRGRVRLVGAGLCLAAVAAAALGAPVVVTPGSLATNIFSHDPAGGATPSSTPQEVLVTCYVTPTADDRTIVLSSRNWNGYTKPITVFYKMVGGGAGNSARHQFDAAGGSSAILKNGAVVAVANGANAGAAATVVSGTFNVTSADTLRFVAGGGAGAGTTAYYYGDYCYYPDYGGYYQYQYHNYAFPGGGGAGYFGGGAGAYAESSCAAPSLPGAQAGIATGGTGIAGGVGAPGNGSSGIGGANPNHGYNGGAGGTTPGAKIAGFWSGYGTAYYQIGGGGNKGQPGSPGGSLQYWSGCGWPTNMPESMPLAQTYDLDPTSGAAGYSYSGTDAGGYSYSCTSGGGRGQIVLRYQAKTCDVIPQYDKN